MVNKKNGEYNPTPVYHRGLLRGIIRNRAIALNGYNNVSAMVHRGFEDIKKNDKKENK